jgi:hypothetical protein
MAAAARENAARFDPAPVARQYEQLFAELAASSAERARLRTRASHRARLRDGLRRLRLLGPARRAARLLRAAAGRIRAV